MIGQHFVLPVGFLDSLIIEFCTEPNCLIAPEENSSLDLFSVVTNKIVTFFF